MPPPPKHFDIHISTALATGQRIDSRFVAFLHHDGEVFWNFDQIVAAFFGDRKSLRVWQVARECRQKLQAVAENLGLDFEASFVPSRRMCQVVDGVAASRYTMDCQCLDSGLTILLHLYWSCFAWRQAQKDKAKALGRTLLSKLLDSQCVSPRDLDEMLEASQTHCDQTDGRRCQHFSAEKLQSLLKESSCPQVAMFDIMVEAFSVAMGCGAAKHTLLCALGSVCEQVDSEFDGKLVATPPHKVEVKSTKLGRKRAPDTYRHFVMRALVKRRRGGNGKKMMQADGYSSSRHHAWLKKETGAYFAACLQSFSDGGVYGIWEDGTRLGNPGQECIVYFGYSCGDRRGCALPPQVIQDWRGMRTQSGKWTSKSKSKWVQKIKMFCGKMAAADVALLKKDPLVDAKHANWNCIMGLDQSIDAVWGTGLRKFMPAKRVGALPPGAKRTFLPVGNLPLAAREPCFDRLRRAFVERPDGSRELECVWASQRNMLVLNLDCGSVGWPSRAFLMQTVGLRVLRVLDPPHRHHNNTLDAGNSAGLQVFRKEALALCNTNGGPWGEAANYQRWKDATLEFLDSTDSTDDLFLCFYPWISRDLHGGMLTSEFGTSDHKEFVRREIRKAVMKGKGIMVRTNRWFSLWQQLRCIFGVWSIHLFANMIMCVQRGTYKHMQECPLFKQRVRADGSIALSAEGTAASSAQGAAARRRVKNGSGDVEGLRGKCENAMHMCTEILGCRSSRAILLAMDKIIRPVEERHSLDITAMKTQMGRSQRNIDMSCGMCSGYLLETLRAWTSPAVLIDMGILSGSVHDTDMVLEPAIAQEVLQSIFAFWRHLVSLEFCLLGFHTNHMPWIAFTQLSKNDRDRQDGIMLMRRMSEKVELVERASEADAELRAFLSDLGWAKCQWSRELLISAAEMDWTRLPKDMTKQVEHVSRVASSSKLVEDAFNEVRAQVEGVRNGRQGPHAVWQACASSSLTEDFDLDPVEVTAEHEVEAPEVPLSLFHAKRREDQVSIADLKQTYFDGDMTHSMSVQRYLQCPLASCALVEAPSVVALKVAWQSLLAVEGTIMWSVGLHDVSGLVLTSTPHSVLLWRGAPAKVGHGFTHFELESTANPWQTVTVWDPAEWRCCDVTPMSSNMLRGSAGLLQTQLPKGQGVVFKLELEHDPSLLTFSARRGFPHLTLEKLLLLWNEHGVTVEGRKPHLLADVLKELCTHFLGPLSPEQWLEIQARRRRYTHKELWHSVVEENSELVKDFCHDKDAPDVKPEPRKPRSVVKPAPQSETPKATSEGRATASASSSASASSDLPPGVKRRKLLAPFCEKFYDQSTAVALLPRTKGSTISLVGNRAWQVKYTERPTAPRSHTVTFYEKGDGCVEHCKALAKCVQWSWDLHHRECGGEACPFDIGTILNR